MSEKKAMRLFEGSEICSYAHVQPIKLLKWWLKRKSRAYERIPERTLHVVRSRHRVVGILLSSIDRF